MKKYLLTYEDALLMVDAYKNFNFSKSEVMMGEYKVVTFNYFMCGYNHFINPLNEKPIINAFDMRGTTFILKNNIVLSRFFMLPKFFNLNQVESTQYDLVKDKKIKNVTIKEDGSLIAFMKLPDETIFAKTQGGFSNEMSVNSMDILNKDSSLKEFVIDSLRLGYTPLFEYVSFDNRIVLKYVKKELRFIGLRNNINGSYISATELNKEHPLHILFVQSISASLDELIEKAKVEKEIEGWVVQFEDDSMLKLKTSWYFDLHYVRTENVFREDYVIKHYLNNTLDDLICQLDKNDDADVFLFIDKCIKGIDNWGAYIDSCVEKLVNKYILEYTDYNKYRTENFRQAFFGLSLNYINGSEDYKKHKIEYMLYKTYRLNNARDIIERYSK